MELLSILKSWRH